MSKLQWGVFGAIVLVVTVTQLTHHDHEAMAGHDHSEPAMAPGDQGGVATVTLAVSGMT